MNVNVHVMYKKFLDYKVRNWGTYVNLIKKVRSVEDLRYTFGLVKLGIKIYLARKITNETVRGR